MSATQAGSELVGIFAEITGVNYHSLHIYAFIENFIAYGYCAFMCAYALVYPVPTEARKRVLCLLPLELEMVVSHYVSAGLEPRSSGRALGALDG